MEQKKNLKLLVFYLTAILMVPNHWIIVGFGVVFGLKEKESTLVFVNK